MPTISRRFAPFATCLVILLATASAVAQAGETWILADDYPAAALAARAEGTSALTWDVTAEGKAENCVVTASSGSADLDQAACTLIVERARYAPALDRKGRPTRSHAGRRVRWVLPIEQPDTSIPYTLRPF